MGLVPLSFADEIKVKITNEDLDQPYQNGLCCPLATALKRRFQSVTVTRSCVLLKDRNYGDDVVSYMIDVRHNMLLEERGSGKYKRHRTFLQRLFNKSFGFKVTLTKI